MPSERIWPRPRANRSARPWPRCQGVGSQFAAMRTTGSGSRIVSFADRIEAKARGERNCHEARDRVQAGVRTRLAQGGPARSPEASETGWRSALVILWLISEKSLGHDRHPPGARNRCDLGQPPSGPADTRIPEAKALAMAIGIARAKNGVRSFSLPPIPLPSGLPMASLDPLPPGSQGGPVGIAGAIR